MPSATSHIEFDKITEHVKVAKSADFAVPEGPVTLQTFLCDLLVEKPGAYFFCIKSLNSFSISFKLCLTKALSGVFLLAIPEMYANLPKPVIVEIYLLEKKNQTEIEFRCS